MALRRDLVMHLHGDGRRAIIHVETRRDLSHSCCSRPGSIMRLGHPRRASSGMAVGLAVVLLGTACSAGPAAEPAAATDIVVGALPIADTVGFYVAVREGFFRQADLNVTVKPVLQSTSAIPDMETGKVDIIAGANYISYFQAEAKDPSDPPFALLAEGTTCAPNAFDILALPSSGITDPAGLAGKTIAINIPNNVQTLTIDTVLRDDAVNPASVRYVTIPFPKMLAALKAHRVDAISVVEPFLTGAELALGAEPVLDECTGPTASFPLSGYFSTRAWARRLPAGPVPGPGGGRHRPRPGGEDPRLLHPGPVARGGGRDYPQPVPHLA